MKLFLLVATVAMITENLLSSYFHGNHFYRKKVLHENAAYQSKLSLKKWSQANKEFSREVVIKLYSLLYCNDADRSSRVKTHQIFFFIVKYLSGFYLFLKMSYFSKIPLMNSLNILCSDSHKFLKRILKKFRKEAHNKIFCGSLQIFKNILWSINRCLKYSMASTKILRPPSYILNVRSLN